MLHSTQKIRYIHKKNIQTMFEENKMAVEFKIKIIARITPEADI